MDNVKENKEQKEFKENKGFHKHHNHKGERKPFDKNHRDGKEQREHREHKEFKEHKEHKEFKEHKEHRPHKEVKASEEVKEARVYPFVAYVSFKDSKKVYSFGCEENIYQVGDYAVVETVRGIEVGKIVRNSETFIPNGMDMKPVIRKATEEDLEQLKLNEEKARRAMMICEECIRNLNLDMHLIEAEYTLDCSKIIFVYVADERVDFRELLKDLASIFKCRIELRQIGPRNKAKIIGGLGTCGRETCCSKFLNDFDVVSINMAKNQLLALNIQKLSGQCGKLMCCLKFEDSQYKVMREGLPKMNSQIIYKGNKYRITSMNVLLQQVKIENKEDVQWLTFSELWPDKKFNY